MTEKELLEALLQEVKSVRQEQKNFTSSLDKLKTDFDEHRAYVTDQFTSAFDILGGLQGDIEEIQNDTQYLSMRNKNRLLFR